MKVAIVTGASRGIGSQIAKQLSNDGYTVVINYAGNEAKALEVLNSINNNGMIYKANVGNYNECEEMVNAVFKQYGQIDLLVNNAGITKDNLVLRMTSDDFNAVLNINLLGTFNMCKLVSKIMMKQKNGKIINMSSVVKETTGKYYVNVLYNVLDIIEEKVKPRWVVGIDLGVKDLVVTSSGEKYKNPKEIKRFEKRIKRLQRKLSRQVKESNNYHKTKIKISKIYSKLKNSRKHNIIKIVNKLIEDYDIIISEKLDIKKMTHKSNLSKNILDASFSKICSMLEWKSKIKGKYYYQIDRYFPSSKICSHCGEKTNKTNNLEIRKWECSKCHSINDRDINASINIMFEGLKYCFDK